MGLGVADRRDELQTWIRSVVSQHDATEIGLWSVVSVHDTPHLCLRYVATPLDAPHATKKRPLRLIYSEACPILIFPTHLTSNQESH